MRHLATLALLLATASACTPTCESVCRKAVDCELSPRLARDECIRECGRQDELYRDWDDEAKQDQFVEHRRCVMGSTCEELEAGVCYDEDSFPF